MQKYYPDGNLADASNVYGYSVAQTVVQVLKQCGKDVSRENIMRAGGQPEELRPADALPGIKVNTSPTDFSPVEQEQLIKFDGKEWVRFGELYDAGQLK